jgi:anti-sigma factor (TIGR02949 family)
MDEPAAEPAAALVDCAESVRELYTFLDGELTEDRRIAIRGHLEGCPDCYGGFDFEFELRQVVSASCREELPPELRSRVAAALANLMRDEPSQPL